MLMIIVHLQLLSSSFSPSSLPSILQRIGEAWVKDLFELKKLLPLADDDKLKQAVYKVKQVWHYLYFISNMIQI